MRHPLSNLRLSIIKLHAPRSTPTPHSLSIPLIPRHHRATPPRRPRLIHRERLSRGKRISSLPPAAGGHRTRESTGRSRRRHVRTDGPSGFLFLGAGRGGRWAFDEFVSLRVAAGEFALEAPERRFGQDFDGGSVPPFDFPVDFWVGGALVVGAVVDDEFVRVGQSTAFVEAAVEDAGAFEAVASPD